MEETQIVIPIEMRRRYLERRRSELQVLEGAIAKNDFETLKRIGHQLKGNAPTYGYPDLERVAIEMEDAGLASDASRAAAALEGFRSWIESVPAV